jgi:AAA domain, putative AbiEii toxin, Type IV TA system
MKIISYLYQDTDKPGWRFTEVKFSRVNLLVGDTATGKSRMLNTIFNLGAVIASNIFKVGNWKITFEHEAITYTLELITSPIDHPSKPGRILKDNLWEHRDDQLIPIIERDSNRFLFCGKQMPQLSSSEASIGLLKEDPKIKPVYEAFSRIQRRVFAEDALRPVMDLSSVLPQQKLADPLSEKQILDYIFLNQTTISTTLYLLKKYSFTTYKNLIEEYKKFFPFVRGAKIIDLSQLQLRQPGLSGKIPVFMIQEADSDDWIPILNLSSGMQKVLLILTDLYILPDGGVYLIDEYENSLGISSIDFFPEFVLSWEKNVQFFITSHHPYLINRIPIKNWYIFHRNGVNVQIKYGGELEEQYGKSKQQAFLQLINDSFYKR